MTEHHRCLIALGLGRRHHHHHHHHHQYHQLSTHDQEEQQQQQQRNAAEAPRTGKTTRPRHIAFVMDGNRRWARKHGLGVEEGYRAGMDQFMRVVDYQLRHKVPVTTFFALSIDNARKRPREERHILRDLVETLAVAVDHVNGADGTGTISSGNDTASLVETLLRWRSAGLCIVVRGNREKARELSAQECGEAEFDRLQGVLARFNRAARQMVGRGGDEEGTAYLVNVAFYYDGQAEVIAAVRNMLRTEPEVCRQPALIDAGRLERHMWFGADVPRPDVIVRTGDAPRLSGFLLWHAAYAEIHLSRKMWPELTEEDFVGIIEWFGGIQRNFGR